MEEETSSSMERTSYIENEPRTLDIHQIQFARETAEYVINTRSIEEALKVFTEGLVPVVNCGCKDEDKVKKVDEEFKPSYNLLKNAELRNIASAPF